ncbi:hypothetical protein [Actinoplanes sp. M2I2]|uniref:hypothetical protein n=1 Tax=Actinoplanes sp. M2I2 TaxID=1734444 RepID=UPI00201FB7D1|nr:hypothetical protein [Actinoplanes sp. M2I2]
MRKLDGASVALAVVFVLDAVAALGVVVATAFSTVLLGADAGLIVLTDGDSFLFDELDLWFGAATSVFALGSAAAFALTCPAAAALVVAVRTRTAGTIAAVLAGALVIWCAAAAAVSVAEPAALTVCAVAGAVNLVALLLAVGVFRPVSPPKSQAESQAVGTSAS